MESHRIPSPLPRSARHLLLGLSVTVGNASVATVSMVRNLGDHLTTHMEMIFHTSNIVKSCYFSCITSLKSAGTYLARKTKERVVNALVTFRLDYCYSLMVPHSTISTNY